MKDTLKYSLMLTGISILLCVSPAGAQTEESKTERRVEEETRASLASTEAVVEPAKAGVSPRQAINREYFKRLINQSRARKVDGVYTVIVLLGKEKQFTSFPAEVEFLKENGYLPKGAAWDLNDSLTKGELAFMLYKALKIKGGVHLRVFGASQRYALSELVFMGIMVRGHQDDVVTGRELAYSFIESADYLAGMNND
jgi:hypothetical protein